VIADRRTVPALTVALAAAGTLLFTGHDTGKAAPLPAGRVDAAAAWPKAARADLPGLLATPLDFLDARTAVGTLPTRDGAYLRLVVESTTGAVRELTRLPADAQPQFAAVTAAGGDLLWAQTSDGGRWQIWTVPQAGGQARRLVADAGDVLLGGGQYDLVFNAGRAYWATAAEGDKSTGIRSVPLAGGPVEVRDEDGQWALTAWPWLTDDVAGGFGTVRLRSLTDGREVRVRASGGEVSDCTADWCRIMVLTAHGDLVRVDLMHPDGSARRQIAGPGARSAVDDVAVVGRFEIFSEPDAYSDLTGTAALVVYDIATSRTVLVAPQAGDVCTHDGMLWWSTGQNDLIWHTLDLRAA
jgi:hypothetical protein